MKNKVIDELKTGETISNFIKAGQFPLYYYIKVKNDSYINYDINLRLNSYDDSLLHNNFSIKGYVVNEETIKRKINGEYTQYSSDQSKARNNGHYGYVSAGMFPYSFENEVYNTAVGTVSRPFKTPYGIHMIRVNKVRDRDDIHAKHILKLFPQGATDEQKAQCKQQIDSIYALLKAGANFEELAKTESQDGSARNGGELGWFGRGRMVQPFEDIAFSLNDGEISEPFATRFGYHIIKKVAHGIAPLSEVRPNIENAISRDERANLIKERRLADMKSKYNYRVNPTFEKMLTARLEENGNKFDSTFVASAIQSSSMPLFTYGNKQSVPVSELMSQINPKARFATADDAKNFIMASIDPVADKVLSKYHARELVKSNPEYRNLLNEYRDGMLLFEISNRRVWKAANKDTVGLESYFAEHRAAYNWDEPHFKGIILSAKNDSILNLVKADVLTMASDTLTDALHYKYGGDIRMERMVVKKGENALADYLAFHQGDKPERKGYDAYMILEGGVINQPEEMSDVRGAVTSDYQDVLEQRWKEDLAKKYPAKIKKKVLKQVK